MAADPSFFAPYKTRELMADDESEIKAKIDAEVEAYRRELELEAKGAVNLSVSDGTGDEKAV